MTTPSPRTTSLPSREEVAGMLTSGGVTLWGDALNDLADAILARLTPVVDDGWRLVPVEPTEAMWGGLARAIVMWLDMHPKTPRALFRHLEAGGHDIPQWLRDEPEMKSLDHVPSKGTRAAIIYRAMLATAPSPEREGE